MTLDPTTYSAFSDELTKIGGIGKTMGGFVRKGWDDLAGIGNMSGGVSKNVRGGGWLGKQVNKDGTKNWRRNLPIGGKSLGVGMTAAMVPSALAKTDSLGKDRSRTERSTSLAGETLGGLMGAGAALSMPGKRFGFLRSIGGAVGGSILGSHAASTPWRVARNRANKPVLSGQERQQLMNQNVVR